MSALRLILERALKLHQAGNTAQAEALYYQILQQWPGEPHALNLLGVIAKQSGRPEAAIDLIGQALDKLPDEPFFHGNLGAAYQAAGRVVDAIRHYREAIRLRPDIAANHVLLSECLQQQGHMDEALRCGLHALQLDPESAGAYVVLGDLAAHRYYSLTEADIQRMQEMLGRGRLSLEDGSRLNFTLAAHWERAGLASDQAFACYRRANDLKREIYRRDNKLFNPGPASRSD